MGKTYSGDDMEAFATCRCAPPADAAPIFSAPDVLVGIPPLCSLRATYR